jgi:hypothetical protein
VHRPAEQQGRKEKSDFHIWQRNYVMKYAVKIGCYVFYVF